MTVDVPYTFATTPAGPVLAAQLDLNFTTLAAGINAGAVAGPVTASGLTMDTGVMLGRTTSGVGAIEEIAIGSGLTLSGGVLAAVGGGGSGTVTSVSVVSTNGFAGSVATATTTPAITISTTITGLLKGNATAISAATAGADYVAPGGALGTPSSGVATNLTGTAAGLTAGHVTTNANLTGVITSVGNATSIASQTGTGSTFVVDTSPTLVTPVLGVATATSINKVAITAPATSATLTIANGKTLTASNTLTFTGTDGSSVAFGAGGTVLYANQTITLTGAVTGSGTTSIATTVASISGTTVSGATGSGNVVFSASPTLSGTVGGALTFSGALTLSSALTYGGVTLSNAVTGTGNMVLSTSPTFTTPVLGTPTSGNLSNCTADGTNSVGFLVIPQNSQSAPYTTVLADSGKQIFHPAADTTARTYTIPANSSVAYPVGTALTFINQNAAGVITIAITTDTMRLAGAGTTGSRTLAANGIATAVKVTSTEWLISGTGLT